MLKIIALLELNSADSVKNLMKLIPALLLGLILIGLVNASPVSLGLKDGSVLKGEVTSVSPLEVVVSTEFGIIRVPIQKLSEEAKKLIGAGNPPSPVQYEARIAQLEARIKSLEGENAQLRKQGATSPQSAVPRSSARPASLAPEPAPQPSAAGTSHSISSTGKRHNSGCRYFSSGKPCGASDGVACKICGG